MKGSGPFRRWLRQGVAALLACCTVGLPAMAQTDTSALEAQLGAARVHLAPDKRTAVFAVRAAAEGRDLSLRGEIQSAGMKSALVGIMASHGWSVHADSLVALPHPSLKGAAFGVVSVSVLNMRVKPEHGAEMASQAILGTPLTVLKLDRGWYLVQTPDKYLGWTDDLFQQMDRDSFEVWTRRPKVMVTATYTFCTVEAGGAGDRVGDLVAGGILALTKTEGEYFKVAYPDGRTGYVRKEDARPYDEWLAGAHDTQGTIVATAHRLMGIPYLWGGTSTKAMDCSGFTKTVYFLNGVLLPRDASQQVFVGDPAPGGDSLDQFQPGDLLFFGFRAGKDRKERVTHVGISLGGRRFIHCSFDVHINSLDPSDADYSDRRRQMFLRARRIIGADADKGVHRLRELPDYSAHAN